MKTLKPLMLAALTALSLGAGSAMAQDGGGSPPDYWAQKYAADLTPQTPAPAADRFAQRMHSFWFRTAPADGAANNQAQVGGDGPGG